MEAVNPANNQGRPTAVDGFGYASNKHLFDWIVDHRRQQEAHQTMLVDMDPKIRDTRPMQIEKQRQDQDVFDEIERTLEIKMSNVDTGLFRRDPYREEYVHTDILDVTY
jgi:hypothetical protein